MLPDKSCWCPTDWIPRYLRTHYFTLVSSTGDVYSLGRKEYGRLGHGKENLEEKSAPCVIASLQGKKCCVVNSGTAVSFAVSEDGELRSL